VIGYVQLTDGRVWQVKRVTLEEGQTVIHFAIEGPYEMPYGGVGKAYLLYELYGQDGELVWKGAVHKDEFIEGEAEVPEGETWDVTVSVALDEHMTNNYRKATRWRTA
jgi:hypothetical protein